MDEKPQQLDFFGEQSVTMYITLGIRLPPLMSGNHVHSCPSCYEHFPCGETCSVEEDLRLDDGTECGSYITCEGCRCYMSLRDSHRKSKREKLGLPTDDQEYECGYRLLLGSLIPKMRLIRNHR